MKNDRLQRWYELSYTQFITIPRLVTESMPEDWQEKFAQLLEEMDDTFDWKPANGRYWVKLRDSRGKYSHAPLNNYRYGNIEHLRKIK